MPSAESQNYVQSWPVLDVTPACVLEATRAVRRIGLSYWDGLIWATAHLAGADTILTEDFSDGQRIEGVRIRNPFSATFDIASVSR